MRRFLALLLALPFAASAQAAPLTLECSGPLTNTTVLNGGVAADLITDIVDTSIVVDFDKRTVRGFGHDLIPITAADATVIIFKGNQNDSLQRRIDGTVDPITGTVYARQTMHWPSGNSSRATWDLRCTPFR